MEAGTAVSLKSVQVLDVIAESLSQATPKPHGLQLRKIIRAIGLD
jgi:hypothetical protein